MLQPDLELTGEEKALIVERRLETEHEEYKYLHMLKRILDKGNLRSDRTGVGTYSIFGTQLSFDLERSFPILTTKKMFFRGIVEELLWFIRGETNSSILEAKGVNIWSGNTSREFLDQRGLFENQVGEAGPVYGFQWRNWGGRGIDQLDNLINTIRSNPNDRRMIISAWNVDDLNKMALPPCHLLHQYYVDKGKLYCHFFMRSVDCLLGLGFNITSYALLTYVLAKVSGLIPGRLTFSGGDTHIYTNHVEQCKVQLSRQPYPFPKLFIKKELRCMSDIESLLYEDFALHEYRYHPSIKAEMAV